MAPEHLLIERDGSVLTIALNRPRVLNALNVALLAELDAEIARAGADGTVGAIVLTGAGDRAFAAGADLAELAAYTPLEAQAHAEWTQGILNRIERLPTPVIAAVNGLAYGGGCELAMACAIRMAADTARFAQPEIKLGVTPGYGASHRLPRFVGRGAALNLLLTGDAITASEAHRLGLVEQVVAAADLRRESLALARRIAAGPAVARRSILDAVHAGTTTSADVAGRHEAALFGLTFATDDMREGTRAFLEKRPAEFRGR